MISIVSDLLAFKCIHYLLNLIQVILKSCIFKNTIMLWLPNILLAFLYILVVSNVCCNRVYSAYPVQADASQPMTERMHSNLSKSTCVACHQLREMPCGFACAPSLRHCCIATLILTLLLATVAGSLDSDSISIMSYQCIEHQHHTVFESL